MKKIISMLLVLMLGIGVLTGCSEDKSTNSNDTNKTQELNSSEKENYKEKVAKALNGYNISDIDITTSTKDKSPIINLTLKINESNANEKIIEKETNPIIEKIKGISNQYFISVQNKDSKIVAVRDQDGIQMQK